MKKNPYANTYIRALNFPRAPFWILDALKNVEKFYDAVVTDGIPRWPSNNAIPPNDLLELWHYMGLPFDFEKATEISRAETDALLADYRERMKNHVPDAEELYEMRAAFGTGVTIVNAITGQKTRL